MRRFVATAGVLALLGAPAVPVRAATPAFSLTITGTRSGWTHVTLAQPATVTKGSFAVSTQGRYAGFALGRAGSVAVAGVRASGWPADGTFDAPQNGAHDVTLAPGRYRLYLLTDGRSSVTVRFRGRGTSRRVVARHPVSSSGSQIDLGSSVTVTKRVPLPGAPSTFALLALTYYADASVATRLATCFRPDATTDCDVAEFTNSAVNEVSRLGDLAVALPGDLPAAGAYGVLRADSVATGAEVLGFYLTFDAA